MKKQDTKSQSSEQNTSTKESSVYRSFLWTCYIVLFAMIAIIFAAIIFFDDSVEGVLAERFLTTTANTHIFLILGACVIAHGIVALFYKPARKISMFVFYLIAGITLAIIEQISLYAARGNEPVVVDRGSSAFTDYGLYVDEPYDTGY